QANGLVRARNHYIKYEYATGATIDTADGNKDLISQSDYYQASSVGLGGEAEYTKPLKGTDGVVDHASLTFMDFNINGDPNSNFWENQLPDINDMPRFVDVSIGLVSSKDMQQAMRIHSSQGETAADDFLANRERVYTRRIFMRNTGTGSLNF
ncbi:MAG: hypothetical protein U9P12_00555, partial [Verrucomicrobiota bacterium]|nr:hypothetical protein [Verrucomicrobiota bacterium]